MVDVSSARVDAPLITLERTRPRKWRLPWQSKVKGYSVLFRGFNVFVQLADGRLLRVKVSAGLETDFYSIPPFARPLIPRSQVGWNQAAVAHDRLYGDNVVEVWTGTEWEPDFSVVRHTADQIMLALMDQLEAPPVRKRAIYWAVRFGGGPVWDARREA